MIMDILAWSTIGGIAVIFLIALVHGFYKDIKSGHFWETDSGVASIIILFLLFMVWCAICMLHLIDKS